MMPLTYNHLNISSNIAITTVNTIQSLPHHLTVAKGVPSCHLRRRVNPKNSDGSKNCHLLEIIIHEQLQLLTTQGSCDELYRLC